MTYETLASFAAQYGTLYIVILFFLAVAWIYRPSGRKKYEDAAHIPLRED